MGCRRFVGLVVLAAVACASSTTTTPTKIDIKATDYDQSCTAPSDCTPIYEGSGCCNICPSAAINVKDKSKYDSAAQQRQSGCIGVACPAIACAGFTLACNANKCAIQSCGAGGCLPDAGAKDASGE